MSNHDFLERAFALADSGNARTVADLRNALIVEGYSRLDIAQLAGHALSRQLQARIKAAGESARC